MLSIVTGIIYWFIGLMVIRAWGGYLTAEHGFLAVLLYVLVVPFNAVLFIVPVKLGQFYNAEDHPETFDAVAILSLVGCFLDVVCVNFFPSIYAQPAPIIALGLAWLLWGIGTGLLVAYAGKDTNVVR